MDSLIAVSLATNAALLVLLMITTGLAIAGWTMHRSDAKHVDELRSEVRHIAGQLDALTAAITEMREGLSRDE